MLNFFVSFCSSVMIEAAADNIPKGRFKTALSQGLQATQGIVKEIENMAEQYGKEQRKYTTTAKTLEYEVQQALER